MSEVQVLVVGGGISGLATAWWLSRLGADVQIWEAAAHPGGRIRTRHDRGYVTEDAAAITTRLRPEVDELVDGVGLSEQTLSRSPLSRRYLVKNGRLAPVPMRLGAMVASPLWSLPGKLRLLAEPFIARGTNDNESVSEFVTRRLGREVLEQAMEPFVAGPLASDPDLAEARSVLPRLIRLERNYGSLTAGVIAHRLMHRRTACTAEGFTFKGGMSALVDSLAASLGPRLHLGHAVHTVEPEGEAWRVEGQRQRTRCSISARHVVLCGPANASADALTSVDPGLAELLHGISYAPLSVVHLGFERDAIDHALDSAGFLIPRNEGTSLTGCLWASSMFAGRAPPGKVLLTCYVGGSRRPETIEWSDDRIVSTALGELSPLLGLRSGPIMVRIHRHGRALPLYHGAYQARLDAIDGHLSELPGLHLEGNYRGGISVQDRIACARSVSMRILALSSPAHPPAYPLFKGGPDLPALAGAPAAQG